jgi:tight adherence protein B
MIVLLISLLAGLSVLAVCRAVMHETDSSVVLRARALSAGPGWSGVSGAGPVQITRAEDKPLDRLAQRLLPRSAVLRARLEATGLTIGLGQYASICLAVFVVAAAIFSWFGMGLTVSLPIAIALGAFVPHAFVGSLAKRRGNKFLKVFPDAIGLMVRGLRAGLPVTETIIVVAREAAAPVGQEFRDVMDQVRLGEPLETAMWATAKRLNLPEFNFLVISLSVQRETGGNLAETLENLNQILRSRSQMRLKIKAMASQATASALIIGSLPFLMAILMLLLSPDYLSVLITDPLGQMMFGAGLASLSVGAFIMRKMVRFEI